MGGGKWHSSTTSCMFEDCIIIHVLEYMTFIFVDVLKEHLTGKKN